MAGRKRKFPTNYIVPPISDNEIDEGDNAEPNETREQHDGLQEHNVLQIAEPGGVAVRDHHEGREEHEANNVVLSPDLHAGPVLVNGPPNAREVDNVNIYAPMDGDDWPAQMDVDNGHHGAPDDDAGFDQGNIDGLPEEVQDRGVNRFDPNDDDDVHEYPEDDDDDDQEHDGK